MSYYCKRCQKTHQAPDDTDYETCEREAAIAAIVTTDYAITLWRDRALKAEAELARVTAEAATLREALDTYAQYHENGETALVAGYLAKRALSSTSAGAGLLDAARELPVLRKRLEASEAMCKAAEDTAACLEHALEGGHLVTSRSTTSWARKCIEAWKRAKDAP